VEQCVNGKLTMAEITDNVFINCPFDDEYKKLFRAIVFTVYRCGFYPRCAMEEDNGLDMRLNKILQIISECRYGIHDISRTEANPNGYPRFNMPFELGLFFACKHYAPDQKNKNAVIFERQKYSYQQSLSDLNGIDTKSHNNEYIQLITKSVNWLSTSSRRKTIPGHHDVVIDFEQFEVNLPAIIEESGLTLADLTFNDLAAIIEDWIEAKLN